jgi:hypothetical protein
MANIINRQQTFSTNGTVTAAGLHNLIDTALVNSAIIKNQQEITTIGTADLLLIAPDSVDASLAPRKVTVQNLLDDGLTAGTFASLNLTGALTYGTATGNRTVSTTATISTATIPNLTAGTTTSTAATITNGTITTGLIPTLTAGTTTGTAGIFTSGTVTTLNSTTGTITNLSTTLAGDFTISQGTGTLGTSGVTLGTYGGATSIPTIVVDAKGRVTTASTSAVSGGGLTGFRNRIINGDMRIDQRNVGASVTPATGAYTLDRWSYYSTQASKFTVQRNAGSVTPPAGYTNYMGITSTSAFSVAASDYFIMTQAIEGFNVSDLSFGTANAKTITLSFWVYSSLTGTFGGVIENSSQARAYPFSYTISSANTWEQKSVTIAGDTTGTWVTDNGLGLWLMFSLGAGSTFSGTAGAWVGSQRLGVTGAVSVVGTNGATFYITGVQLEAGSTATEFERRPIGTEIALCKRYYDKSYNLDVALGAANRNGMVAISTEEYQASAWVPSGSAFKYSCEMRTAPTIAYYDGAGTINRTTVLWNNTITNGVNPTLTFDIGSSGAVSRQSAKTDTGSIQLAHYTASAEL